MSHGMFVWTLPTGKRMACESYAVQYVAEGYGRRRVLSLLERDGEGARMVEYEAKESFDDLLRLLDAARDGDPVFTVSAKEKTDGEAE